MKIKKGDEVQVLAGKDKGKRGKVLRALPREERVVVSGINMVTRHLKPSRTKPEGGIDRSEASIHVSNVALIDPKQNKPTRVGYKTTEDGSKMRVAKLSQEVIHG
ncbi:MAG: 50S ribosomal protein L24 [Alphaproteobacteria bacterium]|nr:50S ribosomal protein L24 [Alphaproteobacteria bacterium]